MQHAVPSPPIEAPVAPSSTTLKQNLCFIQSEGTWVSAQLWKAGHFPPRGLWKSI